MTEKIDLNLNSLVAYLVRKGTEASAATLVEIAKVAETGRGTKSSAAILDEMVRGTGKKITDDHWRATLYFRQTGILTGSVKELKTFLLDPDAHPRSKWAHIVLRIVYEIVASSSTLARRCIDDDLADQLLNREYDAQRTNPATDTRLEKARMPEVINILREEFDEFRKQHPEWKPNTRRQGADYVAKFLYDPFNKRVTKLIRVKKTKLIRGKKRPSPGLGRDRIARLLKEQYPNLFISD